ncbi:MAG: site-specific integrase [Lachnospiraceae bacterium]|nr:site-specific integrase [Lachnospiraceae bacterium]
MGKEDKLVCSNFFSGLIIPVDIERGIINVDGEMLEEIAMKTKEIQQIKKIHKYPIYHSEKSGYFTMVEDDSAPGGKRKIRKVNEEKLYEALKEVYLENSITLRDVYEKWLAYKKTPSNDATIWRLERAWKAYYLKEPLSQKLLDIPMEKITSLMLREWCEEMIKKHSPCDKKKFSRITTIMKQCFEFASDEDRAYIKENIWIRARKKIRGELITNPGTPSDESQVFNDEERDTLDRLVHEDLIKYKNTPTSAGLQILFMLQTGLRIGECCGLKWSDVRNGRLYVTRQANNNRVLEKTKSASGTRDIPLTNKALKILEEVKEFNKAQGFDKEWIFQSNNPNYDYRLSYNAADRKLRKLCERMDSIVKSPHKLRKTTLSILLDSNEVNDRTVQRFAGHKDLSTTLQYYSFERKTKEEQAIAINNALSI